MSKNKREGFWYGWKKEAAAKFNICTEAVRKRYDNADPELIDWVDAEVKRREKLQEIANKKKKELEEKLKLSDKV